MGPRKGSFRARASSVIRSPLGTIQQGQPYVAAAQRRSSNNSAQPPFNEKSDSLERTRSTSSGGNTRPSTGEEAAAHNRDAQRAVRTIPSWVYTQEQLEDGFLSPDPVYLAQHKSSPADKKNINGPQGSIPNEKADWSPPWPGATVEDSTSRWKEFASATAYPRLTSDGGEMVTEEWLRENGPDYYQPWLAGAAHDDSENGTAGLFRSGIKRHAWYVRLQRTILRSPIVPMVIRMIVCGFSAIALALAGSIHHITNKSKTVGQTPSTNMAIIIDAVAIVYLFYIAYDEYSGKPLGLRPAKAKLRLIFLDLFFIVFDSANLSLAFVALLSDNCSESISGSTSGSVSTTPTTSASVPSGTSNASSPSATSKPTCSPLQNETFNDVLRRQKALASVLLIALIAWLLTFGISIIR